MTAFAKPDVTVIVCTRNRIARVLDCLESVRRAAEATDAVVELVVIDNGSTDGTPAAVAAWAATRGDLAVRLLAESRPGASHARNTGIRSARGDLLIFTDDDCRLAADYIAVAVALARADAAPTLRGGRVELGDAKDLPFTVKLDDAREVFDGDANPGGFLLGCNMTLPRGAAALIGPFDPRFGPGAPFESADDTEFLYRAHMAGVAVAYDPGLVVRHHHGRRDLSGLARLNHAYNIGNGALYAKYAFSRPQLLRHFLWDVRDGVLELFGGATFNAELGFSYRAKVWGNLIGALRYLRSAAASIGRPSACVAGRNMDLGLPRP